MNHVTAIVVTGRCEYNRILQKMNYRKVSRRGLPCLCREICDPSSPVRSTRIPHKRRSPSLSLPGGPHAAPGHTAPIRKRIIPTDAASMGPRGPRGPRSDNRGYVKKPLQTASAFIASMGPRSDNRGYGVRRHRARGIIVASMGPRSDNRGYASTSLLVVSQHFDNASARGCLVVARKDSTITSAIVITPYLRTKYETREPVFLEKRDKSKLSKNIPAKNCEFPIQHVTTRKAVGHEGKNKPRPK